VGEENFIDMTPTAPTITAVAAAAVFSSRLCRKHGGIRQLKADQIKKPVQLMRSHPATTAMPRFTI
jgi:hypothetical protein